ncbi:MAG: hypothetical protein COZ18_07305 [Flexibacter sp. CG_4_10_14_3_um_filter_32_15]|nr:MAG: hypothetical protein COZ18_07305 [Flexibacter sp. CG_4_10_14_3_um_filter_32_15]
MNKKLFLTFIFIMTSFISFAQNKSALLSSTTWVADIDQMQAAFDDRYANIDEQLSQLSTQAGRELTDKKAQEERILSVIGQMEMIFEKNNVLKIVNGGVVVLQGTWQINGSTLILVTPQGTEEHQILDISENTLVLQNGETIIHYKDKNTSLVAEGKIAYKGIKMPYSDGVGTFQLTYDDDKLKVEVMPSNAPVEYCNCNVEEIEGYETGRCVSNYFNEGTDGIYIKNDDGLMLIAYFNGLVPRPTFALAPNEDMLNDKEELKKMEEILIDWYHKVAGAYKK